MLEREPFLTAIFADPANDLLRLAFADCLDDHGEHNWAEFIRLDCEIARQQFVDQALTDRRRFLVKQLGPQFAASDRGLPDPGPFVVFPYELIDPDGIRRLACAGHPGWYGATRLTVTGGRLMTPGQIEAIFASPVTSQVNDLCLSGVEQIVVALDGLNDYVYRPTISSRLVEHLCGLRDARRLVSLDLSRNDLDNDAVRALVRSTNLIRLKDLSIHEGNSRVKGRLWGELRGRFGPEVVR